MSLLNRLAEADDEIEHLKMDLEHSSMRIQELNDIIMGDRPDLFHDSLVRGSRVMRMEELTSVMHQIITYIDDVDQKVSYRGKLDSIRNTLNQTVKTDPKPRPWEVI